jgi:hypothetical protein
MIFSIRYFAVKKRFINIAQTASVESLLLGNKFNELSDT